MLVYLEVVVEMSRWQDTETGISQILVLLNKEEES